MTRALCLLLLVATLPHPPKPRRHHRKLESPKGAELARSLARPYAVGIRNYFLVWDYPGPRPANLVFNVWTGSVPSGATNLYLTTTNLTAPMVVSNGAAFFRVSSMFQ